MIMQNPLRDPQNEEPAFLCSKCGGEVWPGETMYEIDDRAVCSDCYDTWVDNFRRTSPVLFAAALGVSTVKV